VDRTLARAMFTSAREVLAKQTETDASSRGDDSTRARDANAPKPSFDVDAEHAKNIARAEAKAERIARAEAKRKRRDDEPKQTSLIDAWRRGGARASTSDVGVGGDVIRRLLSCAPTSFYADARLVCKAWRDAVDDPKFMPCVKLNRALALGGARADAAEAYLNEVTGREPGDAGVGPLARHAATTKTLFKSRLDVETFCRFVEEDEHLSGARDIRGEVQPGYDEPDDLTKIDDFWQSLGTAASRSFLGTVGDVAATIRVIAKFACVQEPITRGGEREADNTRANGWAVLVIAMTHVAENEWIASRLLRAARRALRSDASAEFVEEDLTEFVNLLIAYVRLESRSYADASEPAKVHACRRMKARLSAAYDYANLHDEREQNSSDADLKNVVGNSSAATRPTDTMRKTSRLTHEQEAIVSTSLRPPQWMVVHAFAGSGKTTTLVEYAKRNPSKRFLYLAFNRAITEEAKTKFPANTDAKTFHGLAYGLATWYKAGGKKLHFGDKLRSSEVCKALGKSISDRAVGKGLVTLQNFLVSADENISKEHVPTEGVKPASVDEIIQVAETLWRMMKDRSSNDVPLTHAGYMKLYQLQRPRLDIDMSRNKNKTGYDVILLDEAQDIAPVMFDIVLRQTKCAKILVGDVHQQIYNFTGAMNVMDKIDDLVASHQVTHRRLVRSFRFGVEIANVANAILNIKRESAFLVGARLSELDQTCVFSTENVASSDPRLKTVRGPPPLSTVIVGDGRREQLAVLVRSNYNLISALMYLESSRSKVHVIGGVDALKLDQVCDFVRLILDEDLESISDRYIKMFVTYGGGDLSRFDQRQDQESFVERNALTRIYEIAENQDDADTLNRIRIAQSYREKMFKLVKRLKDSSFLSNELNANFIVATAHKSKGLEFDNVMIWDDFEDVDRVWRRGDKYVSISTDPVFGDADTLVPVDEINLTYVAVTRAKKRVFLNKSIATLLAFPSHGNVPMYDETANGFALFPERFPLRQHRAADRGLSPYVLRRVEFHPNDLQATHESVLNALSWNPLFNGFHASMGTVQVPGEGARPVRIERPVDGNVCQCCIHRVGDLEDMPLLLGTFVWQVDLKSGLVCVSDRGVEQRVCTADSGVRFATADGDAKDAPRFRRPVDDYGDANHHDPAHPRIYALQNPPYLFRTRRCAGCVDPARAREKLRASEFDAYERDEFSRLPLFHTMRYENQLRHDVAISRREKFITVK
jgi:F-box protein 18 (helicase)